MSDLDPVPASPSGRRRRGVSLLAGVVLVLVAIAAWYWWSHRDEAAAAGGSGTAQQAKDGKSGKGGAGKGGRFGGGAGGVQPVQAAAAKVGNVNIVQTALGTATALRTAIVKPRVDGLLQKLLFNEGAIVKEGDVLAQIDPVPLQVALAQAEGTLARDAAQLNNARLDLERYQTLLKQDSIAQQLVDQQAAMVRQLEGTVKISQAQVDNAKLQLSYTRITAPIGGRLGLTQVDPGNQVHTNDANGIAIITQVDPMGVLFTIPQDNLPRVLARLRTGDKPAVEAWDRDQKTLLAKGELVTTDNVIDVTTGTVRLKARFGNVEGKLFPNQFVNVRMVVDVRRDVVTVPSAAVQRGAQGAVLYVVKDDSTVTLRPVTLGPAEANVTAIESGLQAGERVVTDGIDRLREGAKVEVTDPTARPQRAPGAGPAGASGKGGDFKNMDPAKREEMKKKLESMTPEQREEFRKRRAAQGGGG
jgi:multidrug efflux system membrane fusion protein